MEKQNIVFCMKNKQWLTLFTIIYGGKLVVGGLMKSPGGGGGGDSHMKWAGMLVVSLRGANLGFWSRFGCSGQNYF